MTTPDDVLVFWFGDDDADPLTNAPTWFKKDAAFDAEVHRRFGDALEAAVLGEHEDWKDTPRGRLAYIILLDQFSRNVYRDTPRAFAQDPISLGACREGIAAGDDDGLSIVERWFFYMPLMHAEDRDAQQESVDRFAALAEEAEGTPLADALADAYDYAVAHQDIIERFGRYPHRNSILGRASTPEEEAFLEEPGSSF